MNGPDAGSVAVPVWTALADHVLFTSVHTSTAPALSRPIQSMFVLQSGVVRATVQRVSFLGETVDYQVAIADSDVVMRVTAPSLRRLRTGDVVGLRIDPAACVVLADD